MGGHTGRDRVRLCVCGGVTQTFPQVPARDNASPREVRMFVSLCQSPFHFVQHTELKTLLSPLFRAPTPPPIWRACWERETLTLFLVILLPCLAVVRLPTLRLALLACAKKADTSVAAGVRQGQGVRLSPPPKPPRSGSHFLEPSWS